MGSNSYRVSAQIPTKRDFPVELLGGLDGPQRGPIRHYSKEGNKRSLLMNLS